VVSEQVFADGIGPIIVVGRTVRLDFLTFVPDEGEGGSRPKPVVDHRLFMPVEAFLIAARRFSEAAEAIAKLEREQGANRPAAALPPVPALGPAPVSAPVSVPEPPRPTIVSSEPSAERPKPPFP